MKIADLSLKLVYLIAPLFLAHCMQSNVIAPSLQLREYSSKDPAYITGCKAMVDSYCDYLYSPDAMGNLRLMGGTASIDVLQGHTPNDFTAAYYQYAQAILQNRRYLPKDFRAQLLANNYFDSLSQFLTRKPRSKMSLQERLSDNKLARDLGSLWATAMDNSVLERMSRRYPGFYNIKEILLPLELRTESRRARRKLRSEIYQAVWRRHPNWLKVELAFENLRRHFLQLISDLKLSESVRIGWLERIKAVKLVLPGSLPEIADNECSETEVNAYYYTSLNVITVCAGDFNSEDIYQTLAHELSHAIDLDRSFYLYQKNSSIGISLYGLRENVCTPDKFQCNNWARFKNDYEDRLSSLTGFSPPLKEFQRCLKPKKTPNTLNDSTIKRFARQIVINRVAELAESDIFLRITKPNIPLMNGTTTKNPSYFNPCSYYLWSRGEEPVDDDLSLLIFFTAEYRCTQDLPAQERLRSSITVAQNMMLLMTERLIQMEGEFSSDKLLQAEGYASSPSERFADVVGSEALTYLLYDLSDLKARQSLFLASSSWQCKKPSLAKFFPEESQAQYQFTLYSHTETDERRKELFPASLRTALGCQKDFEFEECKIPKLIRLNYSDEFTSNSNYRIFSGLY